jgi:DNA-binding XRE family transcriptional regulator
MPSKKSKANQRLGRTIRSIREQKRYSQESFARHAGFERSNYGAIERGEFNVRFDTGRQSRRRPGHDRRGAL